MLIKIATAQDVTISFGSFIKDTVGVYLLISQLTSGRPMMKEKRQIEVLFFRKKFGHNTLK